MEGLTHINEKGEAMMVDISAKAHTHREAAAEARLEMKHETREMILSGTAPKGDVLAAARIAGIMAAKKTDELIPLCHSVALTSASVDIAPCDKGLLITARAACSYGTGVEMEALTAASVAALTIYDMVKAVDRGLTVKDVRLVSKSGGRSGEFTRGDGE